MGSRIERSLDGTDWRILDELQADGRLSYNELGRRVSLSPPAVAERVRRLEDLGVIVGYQARVDPARAGLPLTAFVQMRCRLDRCLLKTSQSSDYPEIAEIHKLTGDYCSMLKVRAASMEHFEGLLERIGQHGEMRTSVVLSTQYEGRPVQPQSDEFLHATHSAGWRSPTGHEGAEVPRGGGRPGQARP
jgi:Lrp/AsnC family transcriptional regulator, leucine-responsive regulatory protein